MDVPSSSPDPHETARKIERYFELRELSIHLALEGLRLDHPDADAAELRRLLRERLAHFRKGKWGQA